VKASQKDAIRAQLKQLLDSLGLELDIGACGCCNSPWVSVRHNGKLIVDDVESFNFSNFDHGKNDES